MTLKKIEKIDQIFKIDNFSISVIIREIFTKPASFENIKKLEQDLGGFFLVKVLVGEI